MEPTPEVLVVDDDLYLLAALRQTLVLHGYGVEACNNPLEALELVERRVFSAVLADIRMPEMDGLALLDRIVARDADLPVILITGHGDIGMAVEAIKRGAYHFLQKPVDDDCVLATLARAIERRQLVLANRHLERQLTDSRARRTSFYGLIGNHPSMLALYSLIETIGGESDPVLISGETGTGKELVARALHVVGRRDLGPYVAVNMGAIPSEIIESELFGHEKGAFTGAVQRKIGKFEYAGEGTLFLDEICSMPAQLQGKLLRVLEERVFTRLGGNETIPLRARIVTATNRDLSEEIKAGRFREDLYFRLNVLPVPLTPLRQRRMDIPLLADHFWSEYCEGRNEADAGSSCPPELIHQLMLHDWPGNIRELRNAVRRYCVMGGSSDGALFAGHEEQVVPVETTLTWREYMNRQEQRYVEDILRKTRGQVSEAHQRMKISRKSLYDKINKYGIDLQQIREECGDAGQSPSFSRRCDRSEL